MLCFEFDKDFDVEKSIVTDLGLKTESSTGGDMRMAKIICCSDIDKIKGGTVPFVE